MANPGWEKGKSGNPSGRPKRGRALTEILALKAEKTWIVDGKEVPAKEIIAELVVGSLVTGKVSFVDPDERTLKVSSADWISMIKWFYQHVDGDAGKNVTVDGGIVQLAWPWERPGEKEK